MTAKDKVYRPPTPAQRAATTRNWNVRRLRALYALAGQLSPTARAVVQEVINLELEGFGARPSEPPAPLPSAAHMSSYLTSLMQRFL